MPLFVTPFFGVVADAGSLTPRQALSFDQFPEIVIVRAFRAVKVFLADAGGKMQDHFLRADVGIFPQPFEEIA